MGRDIAIVIPTIDRSPGRNYLGPMFQSLIRGGVLESPRVHSVTLVDGGSPDPDLHLAHARAAIGRPGPVPVAACTSPTRLTPTQNAARALTLGHAIGCPWVLFVEDDIAACASFADSVGAWLDRHAGPHLLYTFGSTWLGVKHALGQGRESVAIPAFQFYGTTCVAMRGKDAGDYASHLLAAGKPAQYDLAFHGWVVGRPGAPHEALASCPSFIQHVGDESAISRGRKSIHRYETWPGPGWAYGSTQKEQDAHE